MIIYRDGISYCLATTYSLFFFIICYIYIQGSESCCLAATFANQ